MRRIARKVYQHRFSLLWRAVRPTLGSALAPAFWPAIAALLTYVAWQPFVRPDFDIWRADDGEYHLLRVYVFEHAFRDGQWLPRWVPDLFLGYGYPIFNYYAPGTYYLALVLRALGLDVYSTIQAIGALAACAGAAGAFCLTRTLARDITTVGRPAAVVAGLVTALAYVYAPYPFITNLIVRADLAEAVGLALLPWALLAGWRVGRRPTRGNALWCAAGVGAIVLTHNLTALIALPAALCVGIAAALTGVPSTRRSGLVHLGAGLALAIGLTVFFWLPAMAEQRHVHIEVALGGGHRSPRSWLIDPVGSTGRAGLSKNPQTPSGPLDLHLSYPYDLNYPPKPSLAQGVLWVASVALLAGAALYRRGGTGVVALIGAGTALLWFLTTTWSAWAWDHVPLMRFLQFSWRLYGPLALALGLFAGLGVAVVPRAGPAWLVLCSLLAMNSTSARPLWIDPAVERQVGGPQLVATENTLFGAGTTTGGEFVPRTVDLTGAGELTYRNGVYEHLYPEFGWLGGKVLALEGQVQVLALSAGTTWTEARVKADTPAVLAFRTLVFPGWRAYVDGQEVAPGIAPRNAELSVAPGFITVAVPPGEHRVQIAFGPTRLRTAAGAVSISAMLAAGWWLWSYRRAPAEAPSSRRRAGLRLAPGLTFVVLLAVACAHDAVRPALRAPVRPKADDNRLAADLLELTRSGTAHLTSPGGAQLGTFLDVRRVSISGRERAWLYMHPPSSASFELSLPKRAAFQAGLGVDPGAWDSPAGDGLRFVAEVTPLGESGAGRVVRILDESLNPRSFPGERVWHDRWVDLSAFGGRRVRLTLRTEAGPTTDFDWAGWADPAIVLQRDARRPGGAPPVPLPTPRSS